MKYHKTEIFTIATLKCSQKLKNIRYAGWLIQRAPGNQIAWEKSGVVIKLEN